MTRRILAASALFIVAGFAQLPSPPTLAKSFPPASIVVGGVSTLTFTITNGNPAVTLTSITFTDVLPTGLAVASPASLATTCGGGTIVTGATPGSTTIFVSIPSLPVNSSCTISVNVTAATAGTFLNTSGTIGAGESGPGTVSNTAALTVIADAFQVRYTANLNLGDSVIDIANTGANGAPLLGPGFGAAAGNICVNVFAFSPDEQLISCCSCLITPNGLVSLSFVQDLISNTLTGIRPNSAVIKLIATATGVTRLGAPDFTGTSCTGTAAIAGSATLPLAGGMAAWGTTLHAAPGGLQLTETPFTIATISPAELASITGRCASIIGNGSGFGICKSCRQGALGAQKQ